MLQAGYNKSVVYDNNNIKYTATAVPITLMLTLVNITRLAIILIITRIFGKFQRESVTPALYYNTAREIMPCEYIFLTG